MDAAAAEAAGHGGCTQLKPGTAPQTRKDLADIVARAVTEQNQRREWLDALADFRNDQTVTTTEPSEIQQRHPLVAQLMEVVEDILADLGQEMLIEALLPGIHLFLPPTDFVDSILTAVEVLEMADHPASFETEDGPWSGP